MKIANVFPVLTADDGTVFSAIEMAAQLNRFFSSVFEIEETFVDGPIASDVMTGQISNIVINTHGVACAIDPLIPVVVLTTGY